MDFEKKRRKFSFNEKNALPFVSTYIHTHLDLPTLPLYLSRARHFYGCFLTLIAPFSSSTIISHHITLSPPILAIRLSQSNSHSHSLTETHLHHLFQFNSPHSFHHIQGAVLLPLSSLGFSLCCLQINSNLNPKIQRTSKDS